MLGSGLELIALSHEGSGEGLGAITMSKRVVHRPKKALVTGGSGFIGSNLVRLLLDEGVDVRVMVLPGDPAPNLKEFRDHIEVVEARLGDDAACAAALNGCDTLFHMAAIYAIWLPERRKMFDVNVDGTRRLLVSAKEAGVKRIVYTSSIAAVGHRDGEAVSDEETLFNDWDNASDYVLSKYIAELEVMRLCNEGLPVVIVNPSFPFGGGDVAPTPTGRIILGILRKIPVVFPGGFNAVGVRDVAMGHYLAALYGKRGRRYILGGENLGYDTFIKKVSGMANLSVRHFTLSPKAGIALGKVGDFLADHITHKQPMMAETSVRYTVGRHLYFDSSRAKNELGYKPASVDVAIQEAINWFQNDFRRPHQ